MNSPVSNPDNELSLGEVFSGARRFFSYLRSRKVFILVMVVLFTGLGLLYSFLAKPRYIASATLMLEDDKMGGALAGYLQLASQFGLMSGGATMDEDKVMEIFKSRHIIASALLRKAVVDGKNDLLANHYITAYDLRGSLDDEESTKNFIFRHTDLSKLSHVEDSLLNEFTEDITNDALKVEKLGKSNIVAITLKTPSELLSKNLCEFMLDALSDFYISHITQKERETVDAIQGRVDSIFHVLNILEERYASRKDAVNRLVKVKGYTEELRLKRDIEIMNMAYAEGVKNLEISKFNLLMKTPVIQVIDKPVLPLEKKEIGPALGAFLGLLAGLLGSIVMLMGAYVRKKYMP